MIWFPFKFFCKKTKNDKNIWISTYNAKKIFFEKNIFFEFSKSIFFCHFCFFQKIKFFSELHICFCFSKKIFKFISQKIKKKGFFWNIPFCSKVKWPGSNLLGCFQNFLENGSLWSLKFPNSSTKFEMFSITSINFVLSWTFVELNSMDIGNPL